jgi:hypothetical protein
MQQMQMALGAQSDRGSNVCCRACFLIPIGLVKIKVVTCASKIKIVYSMNFPPTFFFDIHMTPKARHKFSPQITSSSLFQTWACDPYNRTGFQQNPPSEPASPLFWLAAVDQELSVGLFINGNLIFTARIFLHVLIRNYEFA